MDTNPTVFHITHHKSGSQWVRAILENCAPDRIVKPMINIAQFHEYPLIPGGIYPTVYVSREEFKRTAIPQLKGKPYIVFVVIRDLRDTLVSLYYSLKVSHELLDEGQSRRREFLKNASKEEGFVNLLGQMFSIADLQLSWIDDDNILLIKYEDLLANEYDTFKQIINYCQLDIATEKLYGIVKNNSFESITGRKRGDEDVSAHLRKAEVGDWRNHFSERFKKAYKKRFGNALIRTGYESDLNWD